MQEKYMYNYLKTANGYEGTVDGHEVSMAYWIMNARSDLSTGAWIVYCEGDISYNVVGEARHSARAVIEINK